MKKNKTFKSSLKNNILLKYYNFKLAFTNKKEDELKTNNRFSQMIATFTPIAIFLMVTHKLLLPDLIVTGAITALTSCCLNLALKPYSIKDLKEKTHICKVELGIESDKKYKYLQKRALNKEEENYLKAQNESTETTKTAFKPNLDNVEELEF